MHANYKPNNESDVQISSITYTKKKTSFNNCGRKTEDKDNNFFKLDRQFSVKSPTNRMNPKTINDN